MLVFVAAALAVGLIAVLVAYLLPGDTPADRAGSPDRPPLTSDTHADAEASPGGARTPDTARPLKAGYTVSGRWKGGFNAEVTVTNIGSQPIEGWTVLLHLPDGITVTDAWSAEATQKAGALTLRSQPWNTYLAPGASTRMGFEAKGGVADPRSCTVNGFPC
jgi:glucuronoarabinoxylan endo-1,4-beta-xylanase